MKEKKGEKREEGRKIRRNPLKRDHRTMKGGGTTEEHGSTWLFELVFLEPHGHARGKEEER